MQIKLKYEGPGQLKANQLFRAVVRLAVDEGLPAGARVVLAARHVSDFGDPQMGDPSAENYVSVAAGDGQRWALDAPNEWKRHPWNRGIALRLVGGEVPARATITIALGGSEAGCPGYRAQSFAESEFRLWAAVGPDGGGHWTLADEDAFPPIRITGNRAAALRVVVARCTSPDEQLRVHLKAEDAFGNVAEEAVPQVSLAQDDGTPVGSARIEAGRAAVVRTPALPAGRWQQLTAATADGAFYARSNPFGPSPMAGYRLFFGEIHAQSSLCDGTNSPAELYEYARAAAGLDFAAVTSHDFELTAEDWEEIRHAARDAHRPGEFVTFLGYEWSGETKSGGDNNIYYLDDEGPLVYSAPWQGHPAWDASRGQVKGRRDLTETIRQLRGRPAIVVPHCGGRICNFDFYDPAVMPLFEIHSCHRTFEHVAHEAIRRGLRFGFIGGSDDHRGAIGDSHPAARERFFSSHSGLVAAYAKELTREALWEAFFARRVYATNGPRIVLSAAIGGTPMGGEVHAPAGTALKMSFWTRLEGWLDRVEVVRDEAVVRTFQGAENQVCEFSGELDLRAAAEPHAYYVRVFQTDGGRAWSSPIWVAQ